MSPSQGSNAGRALSRFMAAKRTMLISRPCPLTDSSKHSPGTNSFFQARTIANVETQNFQCFGRSLRPLPKAHASPSPLNHLFKREG